MIKKIQSDRITVIIPTMNRTKLLTRFVKYYEKHCKIKTDYVFVNSNKNRIAIHGECREIIESGCNKYVDEYIKPSTVGEARKVGIDIAMSLGNEYILSGDDDCYIGKLAIEKMLAPLYNDSRFWKIGHLGNYRVFMRDFKSNEVRFHLNIGVFWATKLSVIKDIGNIDKTLSAREDVEMDANIWDNGGWTAIVDADVKHSRNQPLEYGERTIPKNYSDEWNAACDLIADRYPNIFKNRNGRLYRQFQLPDIKFSLSDKLKLEIEDSKQKRLFDA